MATIDLHAVHIEFPIYNVNGRSFKKQFIRLATGGSVIKDAHQHVLIHALCGINLSLKHGDRVGLIGHNGAGKSTLLRLLAKIYEPTHGTLNIQGHISPMLDLSQGMEAELTGYENIILRGTLLGFTKRELNERIIEISELTGLGDYLSMPIRTYSAGMMARLAFAISANIRPDILLIDEVFSTGDAAFMQIAQKKMVSLLNESSIVVMANHSDLLLKEFCNKAAVLENGQLKYFGPVDDALELYHAK
jgi:ABC-type polysaccharide/polyol phosphate transport system ATPase subunit